MAGAQHRSIANYKGETARALWTRRCGPVTRWPPTASSRPAELAARPGGPIPRAPSAAAGVLCYDFTESGELVVLLCQMYGGLPSHPSKKQALVHSAWTVPGGKRRESDEGIESTAARELEEDSGGGRDQRS